MTDRPDAHGRARELTLPCSVCSNEFKVLTACAHCKQGMCSHCFSKHGMSCETEVARATEELRSLFTRMGVALHKPAPGVNEWHNERAESAETALRELKEYESEEAAFMAKNGVLYNETFIDGWEKVINERDELRERVRVLTLHHLRHHDDCVKLD